MQRNRGRARSALLPVARLTKKGQLTVPRSIRRRLGVKPGDRIGFRADGRLLPLPRTPLSTLAGVMPPRIGRSRTIAELRQEVSDELSAATRPASAARTV